MQRILIFGANSAIASACAREWVAEGNDVFLVGRNSSKLQSVLADLRVRASHDQCIDGMSVDLCNLAEHENILARAEAVLDGIDVVLIAHGTLPDQKACEASVERTLAEIHTNTS